MRRTADESPSISVQRRPWLRIAFWVLIVVSLASLVLAPLGPLIDRLKAVGPWVGLGLALSEALFIGGLAVMAWSVGVRMGLNPFRWRDRMQTVLARLDRSPLFWVGLSLNTVGAVGTGLVLLVAVVAGLPVTAWGLLALPAADLSLTVALRVAVVSGVRQSPPTNEAIDP